MPRTFFNTLLGVLAIFTVRLPQGSDDFRLAYDSLKPTPWLLTAPFRPGDRNRSGKATPPPSGFEIFRRFPPETFGNVPFSFLLRFMGWHVV
ncbi:MAG TPA: hypothetical protein VMW51_08390, partial [Terriglobia bacterium]|nr:hypothetical protein [Terriglobia bacterium]